MFVATDAGNHGAGLRGTNPDNSLVNFALPGVPGNVLSTPKNVRSTQSNNNVRSTGKSVLSMGCLRVVYGLSTSLFFLK